MESASNLTIQVGLGFEKLSAQKELLLQEIKKLKRQMDAAGKADDQAQMKAISAQLGHVNRELTNVNLELKKHVELTRASSRAHHEEALSLREMALEMGHFAHLAGIGIEGIRALKFGFAGFFAAEAIRNVKEALDTLNKLNSTAKEIGSSPQALKAAQLSFRRTGQDAELGAKQLAGFNEQFDKAVLKQMQTRAGLSGVNVLTGTGGGEGGVLRGTKIGQQQPVQSLQELMRVARGGQVPDLSLALEDPLRFLLGRNVRPQHRAEDMKEATKNLLAIPDAYEVLRNELTKATQGGLSFEQARKRLEEIAAGTEEIKPPPSDAQKHYLDTYNKFLTDSSESLDELKISFGLGAVGIVEASSYLDNWVKLAKKMATGAITEIPAMPLPEGGQTAPAATQPSAAGTAGTAPGAGKADTGMMYASGGYIRGAGSGTSDSILARLSNGEYVLNAASVRRLGVGFLHSLNNFAAGGLVSAPPIRFAEGGLASAAATTPVHLHLGGHVFATTASQSVASALVSEAHRQAISSAGVKPSWFAARPSGH